jgi:hypothetical protein
LTSKRPQLEQLAELLQDKEVVQREEIMALLQANV